MNGGRKRVISTDKNKEMVKDIVLNKSPKSFGYQEYLEYQAVGYLSFLTTGNECQPNTDVENNS